MGFLFVDKEKTVFNDYMTIWKNVVFAILFIFAAGLIFSSVSSPKAQENGQNKTIPYQVRSFEGRALGAGGSIFKNGTSTLREQVSFNPGLVQILDSLAPLKAAVSATIPTEKQENEGIAENLFPQHYIEGIYKMQDALVFLGWMKEEEKKTVQSEKDVLDLLSSMVEVFIAHNAYPTKEDAEAARKAVNVFFPQIWNAERGLYRNKQAAQVIPNYLIKEKPHSILTAYASMKNGIMDGFISAFIPKEAFAQLGVSNIDTFVTIPDCWKSKNIFNKKGGSNLFNLFCNAGICYKPPYDVEFVWDCGKPSDGGGDCPGGKQEKCNVAYLGCLNDEQMGCGPPDKNNAIYDGIPGYEVKATFGWSPYFNFDYSFTCGCDK
jgi:hypothetical protein